MLKIRLSPTGRKRDYHARIVVAESASKRDGKPVAQLGYFSKKTGKAVINRNLYSLWLGRGAIPTRAVLKLINEKTS